MQSCLDNPCCPEARALKLRLEEQVSARKLAMPPPGLLCPALPSTKLCPALPCSALLCSQVQLPCSQAALPCSQAALPCSQAALPCSQVAPATTPMDLAVPTSSRKQVILHTNNTQNASTNDCVRYFDIGKERQEEMIAADKRDEKQKVAATRSPRKKRARGNSSISTNLFSITNGL